MEKHKLNVITLNKELKWLEEVIDFRIKSYFQENTTTKSIYDIQPVSLNNDFSLLAETIKKKQLGFSDRLLLILALTPHIRPQLLDSFFIRNSTFNRGFTEFGGIKSNAHSGFLPTGETFAFLLSGKDLLERIQVFKIFEPNSPLIKHKIVSIESSNNQDPYLSGMINVSPDYIDLFTLGESKKPTFSAKFPATLVDTSLNWNDLILHSNAKASVEHILTWINHQDIIINDLGFKNKIKPGYRALFYGPPGTGKTLTACLLGKSSGRDVYKIDISRISSKWVGETEKNLAKIFELAEMQNWILFFDEADSIFGARTKSDSGNARYSNQQVSYLLQRIEEYPGTVILASNLKKNIDEAFIRRFQSMVYFKIPSEKERYKLWINSFSEPNLLDDDINFKEISKEFIVSGGVIVNVLKFCAIRLIQSNHKKISKQDLIDGITSELKKEGKMSNSN